MSVTLKGPVGRRYNRENVRNSAEDQQKVLDLLYRIPTDEGGRKGTAGATPLAGGDTECPQDLLDAIWAYQRHWKKRGLFHHIDGVVDPGGHTLFRMNLMAGGDAPPPSPADPTPTIIHNDRIPGSWQVTNVSALTVGEIGLAGNVKVEITQPNGNKFVIHGLGVGGGVGIDPVGWLKAVQQAGKLAPAAELTLKTIAETLVKNLGFSAGDLHQMLGGDLLQLTGGRLIANPLNKYIGWPTQVSRQLITGGSEQAPFSILSVGGSFISGGEAGLMSFGSVPHTVSDGGVLMRPVLAYYGSAGLTAKLNAGAQVMTYGILSVTSK